MVIAEAALASLERRLDDVSHDCSSDPARCSVLLHQIAEEGTSLLAAGHGHRAHSIIATSHYLLARIATESGELREALAHLDDAARQHHLANNELAAARTSLGRMHVMDSLGRHGEAVRIGEDTLVELDSFGPSKSVDDVLWLRAALSENVGVALGLVGNHHAAMARFDESAQFFEQVEADEDLLRLRANRGVELLEIGSFSEAVSVLGGVAEAYAAAGDLWWHGVATAHLARAHLAVGATERALEVAWRAVDVLESIGAGVESIRAQIVVAAALVASGRIDEGADAVVEVLRAAATAGLPLERGQAWLMIGLVWSERGKLAVARTAFTKSFTIHKSSGQTRAAARAILAWGELAECAADVDYATEWVRTNLTEADGPLEWARTSLIESTWQSGHERESSIQAGLLRCGSHPPAQLINALERQRASVQREVGQFDEAVGVLRAVHRREARRVRLVPIADRWLANAVSSRSAIDDLIVTLLERDGPGDADEALRLVEDGRASGLVRSAARAKSGESISNHLNTGAALSWRTLGDEVVGFAAIDGSVVTVERLDRQAISRSIEVVSAAVGGSIQSGGGQASASLLITALDSVGVACGVDRLLDSLGSVDILSVSSDQCLETVPVGSIGGLRDQVHVIERPTLSWVSEGSSPSTTLVVAGIGDDLEAMEREIVAIEDAARSVTVIRCPRSLEELAAAVATHNVIHLLGHCIASDGGPTIPMSTWNLSCADVATIDFSRKTVVLSLCSGQRSSMKAQQEPHSVSDALLAAGAATVFGSHWPVPDHASPLGARVLHEAISAGQSPGAALATLRACLRSQHPHPLYWAGWSVRSFATSELFAKEMIR